MNSLSYKFRASNILVNFMNMTTSKKINGVGKTLYHLLQENAITEDFHF